MAIDRLENDSLKKLKNIHHMDAQKKLQKTRKLEREILQRESSQPIIFDCERMEESLTPEVRKEILLRKSMTFMDPSKTTKLPSHCLYDFKKFTKKDFHNVLPPKVLKADYSKFIQSLRCG